ncbi:MAG TPA: NAD-dependent epimerase/dehydratase family protein [Kofleriaceae bacterium]|jgi:dihydroflavonol-4-reductase|nr:NAD-dependent epimerase/dehydratase family protein [Kofleriaceae bacterium]
MSGRSGSRIRVLVTGASGFIGGAVARRLLVHGANVRVLLRPSTRANVPDPSSVEPVFGDLRDAGAVLAAAHGCDAIFHAGGLYSFSADAAELHAINVGGTRSIIAAARQTGARLVHTSSISTIGGMRGGVIPDERQDAGEHAPGPYKASKWLAERLIRDEAARGLDAVIVNPTFPIGWGDVKPTPTGAVIRDFLAGKIPAYVDTGMNVVDIDDVAEGHWLAYERGVRGERYILGNANLMMRELLEQLAELSGRKPPRLRLPYAVALGLAHADALVTGRRANRARVPLEAVRTAKDVRFASSARAVRELGLPQTPVRTALASAVRWFAEQGVVE